MFSLCHAGNPLECSLLNFTVQQQHSFSEVKEVWCHRHTTATSTDADSRPRQTLQRQQTTRGFLLKCRPLKCLQLECHPDTYSDEYYYQSSEWKDGFCPNVDWTCTPLNSARTCGSFDSEGGSCSGLNAYPNVTISDYRSISGNSEMQNEIYHCGPNARGIDAMPLLNWES